MNRREMITLAVAGMVPGSSQSKRIYDYEFEVGCDSKSELLEMMRSLGINPGYAVKVEEGKPK